MVAQRYQNILVGVDGSEQANKAFKKAIEVARRNQGKVWVANVVDQQFTSMMGYVALDAAMIEQEQESAENLINECKEYAQSVNFQDVEGLVAFGSAKEVMAHELPEKYNIDLIMVGQSGLNAMERVVVGSVSSYIIREAKCDILIVSPEEESETNE